MSQSLGEGAAIDIDVIEACSGAHDQLHDATGELRVFLPPRPGRRLGTGGPEGTLASTGGPAELDVSPWHVGVPDEPTASTRLALAADAPPVRESARVICGCRAHRERPASADHKS